jgi:hypothetical protein
MSSNHPKSLKYHKAVEQLRNLMRRSGTCVKRVIKQVSQSPLTVVPFWLCCSAAGDAGV